MVDRNSRTGGTAVRPATPDDVGVLHQFVVELAATEEHPEPVTAHPDDLAVALFGTDAVAEAVVATVDGRPAGFALYYPTYSTVRGHVGLHLEDLYVRSEHQGNGLGHALLAHLATEAVRRGAERLEWWVLRTNEPALRFYQRRGARELAEIAVQRIDGSRLQELAAAS